MPKVAIRQEKCKGCLLCVSFCPQGALQWDNKFNRMGVKPVKPAKGKKCIGCGMCAIICPDGCIEVHK